MSSSSTTQEAAKILKLSQLADRHLVAACVGCRPDDFQNVRRCVSVEHRGAIHEQVVPSPVWPMLLQLALPLQHEEHGLTVTCLNLKVRTCPGPPI